MKHVKIVVFCGLFFLCFAGNVKGGDVDICREYIPMPVEFESWKVETSIVKKGIKEIFYKKTEDESSEHVLAFYIIRPDSTPFLFKWKYVYKGLECTLERKFILRFFYYRFENLPTHRTPRNAI